MPTAAGPVDAGVSAVTGACATSGAGSCVGDWATAEATEDAAASVLADGVSFLPPLAEAKIPMITATASTIHGHMRCFFLAAMAVAVGTTVGVRSTRDLAVVVQLAWS